MDTLSLHDARLLGLDDSWRVESVDLQIEDRRVEIRRSHVGSEVFCPECGGACGLAYHADERRRQHLTRGSLRRVWSRKGTAIGLIWKRLIHTSRGKE
jgi:ribosomal protein S27AE